MQINLLSKLKIKRTKVLIRAAYDLELNSNQTSKCEVLNSFLELKRKICALKLKVEEAARGSRESPRKEQGQDSREEGKIQTQSPRIVNLEPIPEMSNHLEPIPDMSTHLEPIPEMRKMPQKGKRSTKSRRNRKAAPQIRWSATYLKRASTALCQ